MSKELTVLDNIKSKIHTIRGKQVMIDRDLANLYGVSTKRLNEQVKRNSERFPEDFAFQLKEAEVLILRSQFATSSWGGRRYLPLVFTEQGVAMLSSVLKSKKATEVNINIMRAFVAIRKFLSKNKDLIQDMHFIKAKFFDYDKKFKLVFRALEDKTLPEKGIFFNGQVFDAFVFISKLIKKADKNIILIDNYVDEVTLNLLSNKKQSVNIIIYTKDISKKLKLAVKKFNEQYQNLEIIQFDKSHDRFLIIDNQIYHIGASLKDLGKKWFAFSKLNLDKNLILSKLN